MIKRKKKDEYKMVVRTASKKSIFAAIVVIGLLLVVLFSSEVDLGKTENADASLGADANCNVNVDFVAYNDGEVVQVPVVFAPFSISGVIVDKIGIDVSWEATGINVAWETFELHGVLHIYVLDRMGAEREEISPVAYRIDGYGVGDKTGTAAFNFMLASLLNGVTASSGDADGPYWNLKFSISLSAEVLNEYDMSPLNDNTGEMTASFTIRDAGAEFNLDGNIS